MRDYDAKHLINKLGVVDQADYGAIQKRLIAIIAKPAL